MPKMEDLNHIRYRFLFKEQKGQPPAERTFTVFLEKKTHDLVQTVREDEPMPPWTNLSFSKCRTCPLSEADFKFCPAARSLVDVVEFFRDLPSFENVRVVVETDRRTISADTTVQEGLRSLMGLLMPTSGCPVLGRLKPMTFMHLPFSNIDETTFRSVAVHLLGQYCRRQGGGDAVSFDLKELVKTYEEVHRVNVDFLGRLRAASNNDANLNSLVSLDVFTMSVPRSIEGQLEKFRGLFEPWRGPEPPGCGRSD